ncbi:glycosyltransferase [Microlunatus capsulatus]|uniref:Glycosyltransferase involved in cell wall biosynthesis n=1 Tax=Microlunatus capsulatus TaxID=99117 RepID=A0ABS4Z4F9_9ACTN|nr:glycosyltransferase [Microlunatus capsulatus]MBP2415923.1 glycosyltransferase involved in cell wall biosynthesis [Microlunatus capsulatus]
MLTVLDAFRLGGAETLIAQLGRVAPEMGLELDVLSLHGPSEERSKLAPLLEEAGLRPRYLGVDRTLDPRSFVRLVQDVRRRRPDVVHAHLEMAMTLALPAARLAGVPAVGTFHHVHRPLTGRASARERLALEVATRSQAAVFVSQASLVSFRDRYRAGRAVPRSWQVVHNGVDLAYFSPPPDDVAALPADLGLAGRRVVTVLAALRDFKGIVHVVRAWPRVVERHPEVRLLLVGSGTEEASLRAEVDRLGLAGSVVFAGMRSDVPDVLRGSELVVLPSIYGENLPTVLMEAGGCARPVVASDVGGISDIVADGETGLLVPPGQPDALGAAVLRVLDDPALGRRLGEAGRLRMEERFDAHLWARNLCGLYARAAAAGPRGTAA